jgi:hypothetical protein
MFSPGWECPTVPATITSSSSRTAITCSTRCIAASIEPSTIVPLRAAPDPKLLRMAHANTTNDNATVSAAPAMKKESGAGSS